MTGGRFLVGLIAGAGIAFSMASTVFAAQEAGGRQWDLEQFDVETVDEYLGQNQPEGMELSFQDLVVHIGKGEFKEAAKRIGTAVKDALVSRVGAGSRLLGQVVLLGLFGALFSGFSGIFSNGQISETGFFVTYLMLFTACQLDFFRAFRLQKKYFGICWTL